MLIASMSLYTELSCWSRSLWPVTGRWKLRWYYIHVPDAGQCPI